MYKYMCLTNVNIEKKRRLFSLFKSIFDGYDDKNTFNTI